MSAAIAVTPTQRRYIVADAITSVVPWCAPRLFVRTQRNFARAFELRGDDRCARRLARASIRNFGRMAVDFLWVRTLTNASVEANTSLECDEYLWRALEAHRGVILVLPHVGCWDVAAARASAAGLSLVVVTESSWSARLASASRARPGVTLTSGDRSARTLLRALRHNQSVVLLSDLARPGLHTVSVPFFGCDAELPSGPARLSARTGAPIVVLACVRSSACRYRIDFRPPIWPGEESVEELTHRIAAGFEVLIRTYPEQWYPFGQIWTQPGCVSPT